MWFGLPHGAVIFIVVISAIISTLGYLICKGLREDYKEHQAIDEIIGEHTPF